MKTTIVPKCLLGGVIALSLAACGDSDGGNGSSPPDASIVVATNAADASASLDVYSPDLDTLASQFNSGSNEGIAFDETGTLYQAGDSGDFTGLRVFANFASRADGSEFVTGFDRQLDGSAALAGGFAGKGIVVIDALGRVVVADNAAADIKVFSSTAGDGAAPLNTITTVAAPWDIAYDESSDRLYAALTNGTVEIFDDFSTDLNAVADRSIFPADGDGAQLSVNLHGIAILDNQLVVTDVGDAAVADDGQIFTLTDDGTVAGGISADARIGGPRTRLGNPVDVVLVGDTAVVAEKANGLVLSFRGVTSASGDIDPDYARPSAAPESVAVLRRSTNLPVDTSDITTPDSVMALVVSTNPAPPGGLFGGVGDTGQIVLLETDLSAEMGRVDASAGGTVGTPARQLESIQVDARGHAYVSYDNGSAGAANAGMLVINKVGARGDAAVDDANTDRLIAGAGSTLNSPKGVEIVQAQGLVLIADNGEPGIKGFSLEADGNTTPVINVTDVGVASIWDLDYDLAADRLFVAGTDGSVLVYDNFGARAATEAGATVSRTIVPASGGTQISMNLHGIVHVAASNQLIVTDVGDAADATDGQLFVIDNASGANGMVNVRAQIGGDQTSLGNPVDLSFDGNAAYIAEKSNDLVLRYNDVLNLSGQNNVAADAQIAVTKPESVSLVR